MNKNEAIKALTTLETAALQLSTKTSACVYIIQELYAPVDIIKASDPFIRTVRQCDRLVESICDGEGTHIEYLHPYEYLVEVIRLYGTVPQ